MRGRLPKYKAQLHPSVVFRKKMVSSPKPAGIPTKTYAVPPSYTPMSAPRSLYVKAFGVGLLVGAALEYVFVKTNYYNVIRDSKVRELRREAAAANSEA